MNPFVEKYRADHLLFHAVYFHAAALGYIKQFKLSPEEVVLSNTFPKFIEVGSALGKDGLYNHADVNTIIEKLNTNKQTQGVYFAPLDYSASSSNESPTRSKIILTGGTCTAQASHFLSLVFRYKLLGYSIDEGMKLSFKDVATSGEVFRSLQVAYNSIKKIRKCFRF
jgi:hypothetical protein